MKSAPALMEISDAYDQRLFFQLAGFDDHFQQHICRRARVFTGFHQVKTDLLVAAISARYGNTTSTSSAP